MTKSELKQYVESYGPMSNTASPKRNEAINQLLMLNVAPGNDDNWKLILLARNKGLPV